MKIQYISDLHLDYWAYSKKEDWKDLVEVFPVVGNILVVAGDLSSKGKGIDFLNALSYKFKYVLFVPGNHDYWNRTFPIINFKDKPNKNVIILNSEYKVIEDILFVGCTLWTDFNNHDHFVMWNAKQLMNDYKYMRTEGYKRPVTSSDIYNQHVNDIDLIKEARVVSNEQNLKLVVITHHAPSYKSISPYYEGHITNCYYYSNLDNLVNDCACHWIHGHIHYNHEYILGDSFIHCNPRGYSESECGGIEAKYFEI